ncbi:MAG: YqeG family HAD IIIA-type phosphatase [Clostridia bacterium]|nr:YqeG family HAD IIIA-type phosphatase [Clostridia bacterium]
MLKKYLIPDRIFKDIYEITPEFLTSQGVRALVLDIDNTLVTYDDPEPTPPVLEWFRAMNAAGVSISFVSNNEHERVERFNRDLGFYAHGKSAKPFGKYIRRAMAHMGSDESSTALIGDQLLTDIAAGKKAGLRLSLLVPPIKDKTTLFFRSKRKLELPYIAKYYKLHPEEERIWIY